jgi:hypothetical protein
MTVLQISAADPARTLAGARSLIARAALSLRDRVRDAPVPLPAAALGASFFTLIHQIVAP